MQIRNPDQLNDALRDLGNVNHAERMLSSECNEQVERVKEKYAALMYTSVNGQKVSIKERRAELQGAIELYCEAHREEILEEGEKSRRLTAGLIGWRKQKDTIKPLGKTTEKSLIEKVFEGLFERIAKTIAAFTVSRAIDTASVVSFELKWNKAGILKQLSENKMKPNDLKPLGFKFVEGGDEFYCTPDEATVEPRENIAA